MSKKQPKQPAAPDPTIVANAQAAANSETARLQQKMNYVNQYGPDGSIEFNPIGDDRYSMTTRLNPNAQAAYDAQGRVDMSMNQMAEEGIGRLRSTMASPFSFANAPKAPGVDDFSADRDKVTNAIIARNQPMMDRTRAGTETQLRNQGLQPGSEAWKAAMDDVSRQENDANIAALMAGSQEQSRLYGIGTDARGRAIQEMTAERSQPINEIAALLGTGQVSMPNYVGTPQTGVNGTDVMGAYSLSNSVAMNNYNQKVGSRNAFMGALGGLAGAGLGGYMYGMGK